MGGAAPAVETTGIPRAVMMEYYRKQAAADAGLPYGGSLVGGALVGGARDNSMKTAFFRDQILNKGRHPEMAQHLWDEMGQISSKIPIQTVLSAPGRGIDFGNMQPIADELMNQAAHRRILELTRHAQRDRFPDNTAANAAYGGAIYNQRYNPNTPVGDGLEGGDFFGDLLQGLSWLTPMGISMNVANKIAGGKAPKKKAAPKKPAAKKPAAKKPKKSLSGDGWIDDIGQVFSFLTPFGIAGNVAGAVSQL